MTEELDLPVVWDIRFFGTVTASISHEIKNVLTIINETSGLLDDFALKAQLTEGELDPARARDTAAAIARHVRRADGIVRNLNRFAHSADRSRESIDLLDLLELFVALAGRLAANRGARLQLAAEGDAVNVVTAPFSLLHLLWRCLEFALVTLKAVDNLHLVVSDAVRGEDGGCRVELIWETRGENVIDPSVEFPGPIENELLERLPGLSRLWLEKDRILLLLK